MKIAFQADNDLSKSIVRAVVRQEPAIDFRSAQASRLDGVPDREVLALASQQERILVSHDFHTMPGHFREFVQRRRSPGVFLIPQGLPIATAVESLLLIWTVTEPAEWENRLCLIPSLATIAAGTS